MKPSYYIGLDFPKEIRRNVLESAKSSVEVLKRNYKYQEIRVKRKQLLKSLSNRLEVVITDLDKLEKSLPVHKDEDLPAELREKVPKKAKKTKKAETAPKKVKKTEPEEPEDGLSALESRLKSIESKLNKL